MSDRDEDSAIDRFLHDELEVVGRLLGLPGLRLRRAGREARTGERAAGEVALDPDVFLDHGYDADMTIYALLMEACCVVALAAPEAAEDLRLLHEGDAADGRFLYTFTEIAAVRHIEAVLPRFAQVGARVWTDRLASDTRHVDTLPRHHQFLHRLLCDEMLPDTRIRVDPAVEELLGELRDHHGTGRDLIDYSTRFARSASEEMPTAEKLAIWIRIIHPRWRALVERDDQEARRRSEPAPSQSHADERPRALSRTERARLHQAVRDTAATRQSSAGQDRRLVDAAQLRERQIRRETGQPAVVLHSYNREVARLRPSIAALREIYRQLLAEHTQHRRRLRSGHVEGVTLTPERLGQTVLDLRTGIAAPPAFSDYRPRPALHPRGGRTDFVLAVDRSGSMSGEKSAAAASAAVLCLEGLAGIARDLADSGIDAEVRTAVLTFNDTVAMPKPLASGLTLRQRLTTYAQARDAGGGNADTRMLQAVLDLPREAERRRVLIVLADGEADDPERARAQVEQLRRQGWSVFAIAIGSEAAVRLYAPHGRRVDDPLAVPDVLRRLIEEAL